MRIGPVLVCLLALCLSGVALADKYDANEKDWSYGPMTFRADYPEVEPNDTCPGQTIACGDRIVPGNISVSGDWDYYRFYCEAGTPITIGTDAYEGSSVDTYLELYFECGGTIIAYDDDGGPGAFSLISQFPAPSTGYYDVKCRGYGSATGAYILFTQCVIPEPPPNDQCAGAIEIVRCTSGSLAGDLTNATNDYDPGSGGCSSGYPEAGKDVAYFVDLQVGDIVDMTYIQASYDAAFYMVYDCGNVPGTCVIGADASGGTETIHWVCNVARRYYVILDCYGTGQGGPWTLNYNITCPAPTGACCFGHECFIMTEAECIGQGGIYQGNGTYCDPNPCTGPSPSDKTTWGRIKTNYR